MACNCRSGPASLFERNMAMAKQRLIPVCPKHNVNHQWRGDCLAKRYADTRPVVHDGSEEATDQVLKDMAVEDALNEMGW